VSDYLIGALERFANAQLEQSTAARRQVAALAGRHLGIVLTGPDVEVVVTAESDRFSMSRQPAAVADVVIAGTPIALIEALRRGKSGLIGRSEVAVTGDVHVLEAFSEVFAHLRPDVEELLATITGDIVAHESLRAVASIRDFGRRALEALAMNTGEYLQEENRALPARHEFDAFAADVDQLRDDVERAAARLDRLSVQSDNDRDAAAERRRD
jgi:ubiquinone biosynthesis protein UbiJ